MFYQVTEAYQILSDKEKKKAYDTTLKTGRIERDWVTGADSRLRGNDKESGNDSAGGGSEETLGYSRATHDEDEGFRQKEFHQYRRQMLAQAVVRVIITAMVGGLAGNTLTLILNGSRLIGVVAGLAFALVWSVNRHFDLPSFIADRPHLLLARWSGRILQAFSVLYFAGLFGYQILHATT